MRNTFKIAAIRARIEFCEAERRQLLKMMTRSQVNIAWISERNLLANSRSGRWLSFGDNKAKSLFQSRYGFILLVLGGSNSAALTSTPARRTRQFSPVPLGLWCFRSGSTQ